ncbi:hypothetical protein RB213_013969 [Colletotrichum asianum]
MCGYNRLIGVGWGGTGCMKRYQSGFLSPSSSLPQVSTA